MVMTIQYEPDREDGAREKFSRALAVAGALYGLLAALAGTIAVAGLFGLVGLTADPLATEPAQLLGLPWSLAAGPPDAQGVGATMLITLGALALNLVILVAAAKLVGGRRRRV